MIGATFALSVGASAWALDPAALPTNGQVQGGNATISQSAARMDINQSTQNVIINWATFNIGSGAQVNFAQPDASSIALNRVNAASGVSDIAGQLNANGMVFLVNPAGVLFSSSAQVNVGGLVASSLNIADSDFLAGNYVFAKDGSAGEVVNLLSNITVANGTIVLLAPTVSNDGGTLSSPGGGIALGAGDSVRLELNGNKLIGFEVTQAALGASIFNSGVISANGGQVWLTAKATGDLAATIINNTGIIEAKNVEDVAGIVRLVADGGSISMSGGGLIGGGSIVSENVSIDTPVLGTGLNLLDGSPGIITSDGSSGSSLPPSIVVNGGYAVTLSSGDLTLGGGATISVASSGSPLPTPRVVSGNASFTPAGSGSINVTSSNGSVSNWNTFSIAAGEATQFIQPSASSPVLNRVTGAETLITGTETPITGQLVANGPVFLVKPTGEVISSTVRSEAGGLLLSNGASVRMGVAPASAVARESRPVANGFTAAVASGNGAVASGLTRIEGGGLGLPRGIE